MVDLGLTGTPFFSKKLDWKNKRTAIVLHAFLGRLFVGPIDVSTLSQTFLVLGLRLELI